MKYLTALFSTFIIFSSSVGALELYVSHQGKTNNKGEKSSPIPLREAISRASAQLKKRKSSAQPITINILPGQYFFEKPFFLGSEFKGSKKAPITIRSLGGKALFNGSKKIPASSFAPVTSKEERARLAASAVDKIYAATVTDPTLIKKFSQRLMISLSIDGTNYLPSVFPNEGYAGFQEKTVAPEVSPPAIPVGKEGYSIRAGNPPYQEPGKRQSWRGSLKEPRGAQARFSKKSPSMAGTWAQWEAELKRNNSRNTLTGFIEANWLLSSQAIYAASAKTQSIHLSRALGYGWAWKKNDKPFRVFGMLCELDQPGEWHFDPISKRLFVYSAKPIQKDTEISLPIAPGFLTLSNTSHVSVIGLSVKNVGGGSVYSISRGHDNLIASSTISDSTATGLHISGKNNTATACNLIDLNNHVSLSGGRRSPTEITPGGNEVSNCHIYQKNVRHNKVNVSLNGVGNIFRSNLIHNSLGQAITIRGNDHIIEYNECFNIGYDEGDGGAMYAGGDMTGYGVIYRYNFFHHLMHVPGKVPRSGIHLDDHQAGSTCIGNLFYKSAEKGIFMNGGAGHTLRDNIFLEGDRGIYNVGHNGEREYLRQNAILKDPKHDYRRTKENYVGRVERIVGKKGWSKEPWLSKYPTFNQVMSDTARFGRMWPIRCYVENNFYYNNRYNRTIWSRVAPEAMKKVQIKGDKKITPESFADYDKLDLRIKGKGLPKIDFNKIGLQLDSYRDEMPDKTNYRVKVKAFFKGIKSMPGTRKKIDTAKIVESGPIIRRG